MTVPMARVVRRLFWSRIRDGATTLDAARAAGISSQQGDVWFRNAGGMVPLSLLPPSGRFLSISEREQIHSGMSQGWSIRAIAASIGRSPSTVMRELRRNLVRQQYRSRSNLGRPVSIPWRYSPSIAQRRADQRLARPKPSKLAVNDRLRDAVQAGLVAKLSPEQIMRRLPLDFPDEAEMRVSHETIYQSLYVQGRGALRRELTDCLRTGRALRKPARRATSRGKRIPDMVMISERPAEVQDRAVPGHWEGDLIVGKDSGSAIGTLVERQTRFVMLLHLPDRHGAVEVQTAMIEQMRKLPQFLRKTLTWDQGSELAGHRNITAALEMGVYFCDPHSPWQRGSNENTNGLLRQYFPKGTDLSGYHRDYLDFVANQLNDRPRKTLDWATPKEALDQLLSNPPVDDVALTT
jgi:IS30 family transposase